MLYLKPAVSYSIRETSAACSPKLEIPKLVKEIAMYGAAWVAVRHSLGPAGELAQEDVSGAILVMSWGEIDAARRVRGVAVARVNRVVRSVIVSILACARPARVLQFEEMSVCNE